MKISEAHWAIRANVEYWTRTDADYLLAFPPLHTSYYGVQENNAIRVYGVTWEGADLSKGKVFTPANEQELIEQVNAARKESFGDFGDSWPRSDGSVMTIDCFVFNSPVRMRQKWGASCSTSLLSDEKLSPQHRTIKAPTGSRIVIDKRAQAIRFEDETEDSVTLVVI